MTSPRTPPPSRADAWKRAGWYALVLATVLLLLLKMFTPLVFGAAFVFALLVFLFGLAFVLRTTPESGG